MPRHSKPNKGICYLCNKYYAKQSMTRHLKSCAKRLKGDMEVFHIYITATYLPMYWLHIEMPVTSTLRDLDKFIRDIWVECCDHLSEFVIEGVRYMPGYALRHIDWTLWGFERPLEMEKARLSDVLDVGLTFDYTYDFGSSTNLRLKVVDRRFTEPFEKVRILARNEPPKYSCNKCGKEAKWICQLCLERGKGYLCDECARRHKHGEEFLLPLVNSPRTGVCGYEGSEVYSNYI